MVVVVMVVMLVVVVLLVVVVRMRWSGSCVGLVLSAISGNGHLEDGDRGVHGPCDFLRRAFPTAKPRARIPRATRPRRRRRRRNKLSREGRELGAGRADSEVCRRQRCGGRGARRDSGLDLGGRWGRERRGRRELGRREGLARGEDRGDEDGVVLLVVRVAEVGAEPRHLSWRMEDRG